MLYSVDKKQKKRKTDTGSTSGGLKNPVNNNSPPYHHHVIINAYSLFRLPYSFTPSPPPCGPSIHFKPFQGSPLSPPVYSSSFHPFLDILHSPLFPRLPSVFG